MNKTTETPQKTVGDIVSVYQKPLSREDIEGIAKLVKRIPSNQDSRSLEKWEVVFLSDEFRTHRMIHVDDLKLE